MNKVIFIDSTHPVLAEELEKMGYQCDYLSEIIPQSADYKSQTSEIISAYTGIIIRSKFKIDKAFIDRAINLKFIGRVGSGLENIDVSYAEKKRIVCLNSPEGNRDAVGEHVIGMLLALVNNICKADIEVKQGIWQREANRGIELKGKTIGIIGYGNMGSSFAAKLKGFEVRLLAFDKYKKKYSDENVQEVTLEKLFAETDILSLHVPLTEETTYMVNDKFINNFKNNIYLLNSSRGKVVKDR